MVSFYVKSMFTSLPVDLALLITKERLQREKNLAERTNLSVNHILRFSDFALNQNYFKYDGMATTTNRFMAVPWFSH